MEDQVNRFERYNSFSDMMSYASSCIKYLEEKYGFEFFKKAYSFYTVPGGRYGRSDKTIFEYFYGNRIYQSRSYAYNGKLMRKLCTEIGTTILYQCHDDGYVSCQLFPAKSENMSPIEDCIFLEMYISPEKITDYLLEKHFKYFLSYMQVTSLDGSPTLFDKLKIWWIRFNNPSIVNNIFYPPKRNKVFGGVLKFVLTVGMSGFVLFFLQKFFEDDIKLFFLFQI